MFYSPTSVCTTRTYALLSRCGSIRYRSKKQARFPVISNSLHLICAPLRFTHRPPHTMAHALVGMGIHQSTKIYCKIPDVCEVWLALALNVEAARPSHDRSATCKARFRLPRLRHSTLYACVELAIDSFYTACSCLFAPLLCFGAGS